MQKLYLFKKKSINNEVFKILYISYVKKNITY